VIDLDDVKHAHVFIIDYGFDDFQLSVTWQPAHAFKRATRARGWRHARWYRIIP
jgi:hypothetical protein